ncbi:hypothetical protein SCUCBS95973_009935 [Sporothrix curviconia]|uniref:DNA2/NAM7 helicase helicase domain-containing protein n=1 Tax=Sporothrix curviconia TaxID=1260050 RepID=A0ABP0CZ70_9PEZI
MEHVADAAVPCDEVTLDDATGDAIMSADAAVPCDEVMLDDATGDAIKTAYLVIKEQAEALQDAGHLAGESDSSNPSDLRLFNTLKKDGKCETSSHKCFLKVDGKIFSNPSPDDFVNTVTSQSAVFQMAKLFYPADDYSCIRIFLFVKSISESNALAHIDIWCKDIEHISCSPLAADEALLAAQAFTRDAKKVAPFMFTFKIKARVASASIPHLTSSALWNVGQAHQDIFAQLRVELMRDSASNLELLVPGHTFEQAMSFVGQFYSTVELCRSREAAVNPLARYFIRSPKAMMLNISNVVNPEDPEYTQPQWNQSITKWVNARQQLVHHMYASSFEQINEENHIDVASTVSFRAFALRLPHFPNDVKFALLVDQGDNHVYLPRHGQSCKVTSKAFQFPVSTEGIDMRTLAKEVVGIMQAVQRDGDQLDVVRDKLSRFFPDDASDALFQSLYLGTEETMEEWRKRIEDILLTSPHTALQLDDSLGTQDTDNKWLPAQRYDAPFGPVGPQYQLFIAKKPFKKPVGTSDDGDSTDISVVDVQVPMLDRLEGENIDGFLKRAMDEKMAFEVSFFLASSSKTFESESYAINSLVHPPSANCVIGQGSLDAYKYLIDFNATKYVNLLERCPGIGNVVLKTQGDGEGDETHPPSWVASRYLALNRFMKEAFVSFAKIPNGVSLIAGVAGCGKSTLLRTIALTAQFGLCPRSTSPDRAPRSETSILYIVNNNDGVDNFADELQEMYASTGFADNSPQVLRLFSMESEVASMTNKKLQLHEFAFDAKSASDDLDLLLDIFLAERLALKLAVEIHTATEQDRLRKKKQRKISLHRAALQYFEDHKAEEWLKDFAELITVVDSGASLTSDQRATFKAMTKQLYQVFLGEFKGIICATPVACADFTVKQSFRPDLVMIDEAARMREMTTLIPVTWFDPKAFIIVGDIHQLQPHVGFLETYPVPFKSSLSRSILARAVDAGAVSNYLTINYRQLGDLSSKIGCHFFRDKSTTNSQTRRADF